MSFLEKMDQVHQNLISFPYKFEENVSTDNKTTENEVKVTKN